MRCLFTMKLSLLSLLSSTALLSLLSCQPSCTAHHLSQRSTEVTPIAKSSDTKKAERPVELAISPRWRNQIARGSRGQRPVNETLWASDRIWGHLALPAEAVRRLNLLWRQAPQQLKVVVYGDSHTQGGYLGAAIGEELSLLSAERAPGERPPLLQTLPTPPLTSPGFVTVDHPIRSRAHVNTEGHWIRQNWLYSADRGPFGPLGIAFVTQDRAASLKLTIDTKSEIGHNGVEVSAYFDETGEELPFCLEARPRDGVAGAPPQASPAPAGLTLSACHQPKPSLSVTERADAQNTVDSATDAPQKRRGQLKIWVPPRHHAELSLRGGSRVSDHLMNKRARSRRAVRRRRKRLRKRGVSREELDRRVKAPEYARDPALALPDSPSLRVFGFHVRDRSARVEVSSMGVRGATIWSPVEQADPSMERWVHDLEPHIIALWYGTNTAARERTNLSRYRSRYQSLIRSLKASAPKSTCLAILPPDFGRRDRECFLTKRQRKLIARRRKSTAFKQELSDSRPARVCAPDELLNTRKRGRHRFPIPEARTDEEWERYKLTCQFRPPALLKDLIEIQREVALEEGCAVYDTFAAMGGAGGIHSWACVESERWAQLDLVHLTPRGYQALGARIAQGLYSAYSSSPLPPPPLGPPPPTAVEPQPQETPEQEPLNELELNSARVR